MSEIPDIEVEKTRDSILERASVVWIVPLGALAIALAVAIYSFTERGPLIEIAFDNASGVAAGETQLHFRDVTVGLVEAVTFTDGLNQVLVSVRLEKKVAPYVDRDAEFWVVRPEVTTRGVSGLSTVLSGVYIEGHWDAEIGEPAQRFAGLSSAPLEGTGREGLRIEVRTTRQSGLTDGTPILYKGIEVGRMGKAEISPNGVAVTAPAIIYEPYDKLVNSATRFWDVSGVSFSLGAGGAKLDFASLASLLSGGVTFDTIVSGGIPINDGVVFEVYPDESAARNSVFAGSAGVELNLSAIFEDNISGLTEGAPVELAGVRIGEVANLTGIVDSDLFGDNRVRLLSNLTLRAARLGLDAEVSEQETLDFLSARVAEGLRARLSTASLLTGGLKVELVSVPDAPAASLDTSFGPYPVIPTTDSDISDVSASAQGVLERVSSLPIEELLDNAIEFLGQLNSIASDEDLRETPAELRGLLQDARSLVGSDAVKSMPEDLDIILKDLVAASGDLKTLMGDLIEAKAVDQLTDALNASSEAADSVYETFEGVPELVEQLNIVARNASEVPFADLAAQIEEVLETANTVLGADATKAMPQKVNDALEQLSEVLRELREGGVVENANEAIVSARTAADGLSASIEGVPDLVEQLNKVAQNAAEVPLTDLAEQIDAVLGAADDFLSAEDTRKLPQSLNSALDQLSAALLEMREGGLIENANETMGSARLAADSLAKSAEDLPEIAERLNTLIARASATLAAYGAKSELNRNAQSALRDVQRAAEAINSLARALERQPNSILFGR
jgi:paraquat-inducible protein B